MAQDSQNTECLFDFLYIDRDRINSYCAQLFDDGVLTSVKKIARHDNTKNTELTGQAMVAKLSLEDHETTSAGQERQFEAGWSNVISVIAELNGKGFLSNDLEKSSIGNMVCLQGRMVVLDIETIKKLFTPAIYAQFAGVKITHANKAALAAEKKEATALIDVLKAIPSMVQMCLETENKRLVWATLNPSFLTVTTNDIGVKYGIHVDGEWWVIGLLDAKPSDGKEEKVSAPNEFTASLMKAIDGVRATVGRPSRAWGMTPLRFIAPSNPPDCAPRCTRAPLG